MFFSFSVQAPGVQWYPPLQGCVAWHAPWSMLLDGVCCTAQGCTQGRCCLMAVLLVLHTFEGRIKLQKAI